MQANRRLLRISILSLLPLLLCAAAPAPAPSKVATTQPAAEWMHLPIEKWPQLVLTNEASFVDHSPLHGASSFLVRMPDGEVVVGTAKHLIKKPGGVDPPIALSDLDHVLTEWKVFPRTKENQAIEASGVVERTNGETLHDWLLLQLRKAPSHLPSTPLIPRTDPVKIGEKVFLVGVSYSDRGSTQKVYEGVVTARPKANYFTYDFKPPVRIAGFSGAPIVDANGLLVGHGVSMSEELKQENGLEIEFGGEDASLALQLWRHRNDAPATRPAEALHLDLPEGWVPKTSKSAKVLKFAEYPPLVAFFELIAEPTADFSDDTDLMKWASLVKPNAAKSTTVSNREETELRAGSIAGRNTVEYEITGELKGVKLRYRIIMLEWNGCYCKIACWTTSSHWADAQSKFEEIVNALR